MSVAAAKRAARECRRAVTTVGTFGKLLKALEADHDRQYASLREEAAAEKTKQTKAEVAKRVAVNNSIVHGSSALALAPSVEPQTMVPADVAGVQVTPHSSMWADGGELYASLAKQSKPSASSRYKLIHVA